MSQKSRDCKKQTMDILPNSLLPFFYTIYRGLLNWSTLYGMSLFGYFMCEKPNLLSVQVPCPWQSSGHFSISHWEPAQLSWQWQMPRSHDPWEEQSGGSQRGSWTHRIVVTFLSHWNWELFLLKGYNNCIFKIFQKPLAYEQMWVKRVQKLWISSDLLLTI